LSPDRPRAELSGPAPDRLRAVVAFCLALTAAASALAEGPPGVIASRLRARLATPQTVPGVVDAARPAHVVWVFFRDKGPQPQLRLEEARGRLTPRALSRRALRGRRGRLVGFEDLPLHRHYVDEVLRVGVRLRHQSRWFNAVSVEADATQIEALARLGFVARLDLVARQRRPLEPPTLGCDEPTDMEMPPGATLDYGDSWGQLAQIGVPSAHELGLDGAGVIVAVLDSGFDNLGHEVFAGTRILAAYDFVNHDEDVGDGADMGEGSHGTSTLSVLGGFRNGRLVGPAFASSFILAKTENSDSETPIEEDNWAAAAEWAEGMGADVISSSLSYFAFDDPGDSYGYADMDGETAVSTRAAALAAERGVMVVNSAGNAGYHPSQGTIGAPADAELVLAVGAVAPEGYRVAFSSVGPTSDGRIKPDVMAQGQSVLVAGSAGVDAYRRANGTSFSCPLVAGVVALVLQAHPQYTPEQVIELLRTTASNAASPNNLDGWGIVDAVAAIRTPLPN
jgi:hypothetical protein